MGGGGTSTGTGGVGSTGSGGGTTTGGGSGGCGAGTGASGDTSTAGAGAGSAFGVSMGGAGRMRGAGAGFFGCSLSGNCVVVFSGTEDSGVLEKTAALSAGCAAAGARSVIARLATGGAVGLIGCTYWYTT